MDLAAKVRNAVTIATFAVVVAAALNARPLPMRSFESSIILNSNGSALVVEDIELLLASGPFDRELRTHYPDLLGSSHLHIDVAEVSDGSGHPIGYYTLQGPTTLTIRVPRVSTRTLQIIYGVRNAAIFAGDHDEFFWIANNTGASVEAASVQLTLPAAAAGQFRAQSFLRLENDVQSRTALWSYNGLVPLRATAAVIHVSAPGPLASGVAMIVNVFLPKGVLSRPHELVRVGWYLRANPILFLPLGAWLVMLVLRRIKPPADPGRSVAPMYEPPAGFSPAEIGILVDDRLDPRDICSTLIDLAVRGYVRLEETTPDQGATMPGPDYIVRLLKAASEWAPLATHERTMLFHTFYGGQWTKLSSLRLRFPDIVPYMKADLLQSLKQKHMYRVDPETAQAWRLAAVFAVAALLGFAQMLGIVSLADSLLLSGLSLAASGFVVYWLGRDLTAKTLRGMKTWIAIRGFEEFLRSVEGDRLQRMEPNTFEKYLPYAMALGIEHRWTRNFQGIATARPEWLETSDTGLLAGLQAGLFDSVSFGHRLDLMFNQALSGVAHPPSAAFRAAAKGQG
jgi:hypothetical protein